MAGRVTLFVCTLFTLGISLTQGSLVQFIATPTEVKQGLTSQVTLTCRVPAVATSGAVVGKRDVSDVAEVTSLVVMKDGKDIASVSHADSAHLMTSDNNVLVSGSVQGNAAELGYLQVTFTDPLDAQTGEYKCEVNAVSHSGHVFTSSANLEVTSTTPTITDLVTYVREMKHTIADLQHKLNTRVFFSAALTKQVTLPAKATLVFDKVLMNVGGGYSASSGAFTCPVAGYYLFEMHALSAYNHVFGLTIYHNGQALLNFYGPNGNSHQGASQSTVLKLEKGDTVTLRGYQASSVIFGTTNDIHTTFTGVLVGLP